MSELTLKALPEATDEGVHDEVHEVYQGDNYIGMVCRHPQTKKWAATWNMTPTNSDAFPFASKRDALDVLVTQAERFR